MDKEQAARAEAIIKKMTVNARAFTEALALPPEAIPAAIEILYKDGKLPDMSEASLAQYVEKTMLPRVGVVKLYILALAPEKAESLVVIIWQLAAKFLLAHSDAKLETLEPLMEVIIRLPLEVFAGTYDRLMEAFQSLDLNDNIRYADVSQFLPFVSLCGWIVLLFWISRNHVRFNLPDFTREQIQGFITEEAEARGLLPEVSRELSVFSFDVLSHFMRDDI